MTTEFRRTLDQGFSALDHQHGYFAQQNWKCCTTCGTAAVPDKYENYVFYHAQDAQRLYQEDRVYLAWGGDPHPIIEVFCKLGLVVDWDGSKHRKIVISASNKH